MKKQYITPAIAAILVETTDVIAQSPRVQIFNMPGGGIQGGENEEAEAVSYRSTLWE